MFGIISCKEHCEEPVETGLIDEDLNGLEQDDPRVIDAVKSRLIPPSDKSYNFSKQHVDLKGQFNQAEIVAKLFDGKKDGFFIEAGYCIFIY